ncbi:hypothetical protein D3C81_1594700 [compost metagenome]
MRFARHLFVQHIQMVFIDMRIADKVGEPLRLVTGQAADYMQQRGGFGQVERRAEADIVAADVEAERNLFGRGIRDELVQQMAGRQCNRIEVGTVPAVEQDAAAARVLDDGIQAITQLVDGLVQQDFVLAFVVDSRHHAETALLRIVDLRLLTCVQQLVGRPLAPLHAIYRAEVVGAGTVGIIQPFGVFIGVLVPHLAT